MHLVVVIVSDIARLSIPEGLGSFGETRRIPGGIVWIVSGEPDLVFRIVSGKPDLIVWIISGGTRNSNPFRD